jgi:cell filamentation protein
LGRFKKIEEAPLNRRDKYDLSGFSETQFEPGSRKRVLKNLMGIKNKLDMDKIEAVALKQTEDLLFHTYDRKHRFSAADLCKIHKIWLGKIYEWAGKYRNIDLAKGNFRFAHAKYLRFVKVMAALVVFSRHLWQPRRVFRR